MTTTHASASMASIPARVGRSKPWWPANPTRVALDLLGAGVSVAAAAVLLAWPAGTWLPLDALVVLPFTQCLLFLVSGTYHGFRWAPAAKARWQRADHAMIYVKVAGTATAIASLADAPFVSPAVIVAAWVMAAGGIVQKTWFPRVAHGYSMAAQFLQALLVLLVFGPFVNRYPGAPTALLAWAMAFYLVGFTVFVRAQPRLWPGRFCHHDFFHVMLICGALSIYGCVAHCVSLVSSG